MANNLTEDLGQLFERHKEKFNQPFDPFKRAREIVDTLRHIKDLKEDER